MAVRIAARKKRVLAATGWSNSTLYEKIEKGLFPSPVKLDPAGRSVTWFEDQLEELQNRAVPSDSKSPFTKAVEGAVKRKAEAATITDQAANEPRAA
jgi:predicted DNA-binding transcriptional regulator AlpA